MVSPAPAPTASTATNARPLSRPWRSTGCTSSSLRPSSVAFFIVQTTLPIMRPSIISEGLELKVQIERKVPRRNASCTYGAASAALVALLPLLPPCSGELDLVLRVEFDRIHDADDGGVHRAIFALGGVARRAA